MILRNRILLGEEPFLTFIRFLIKRNEKEDKVREFEKKFRHYIGGKFSVSISSARVGLYLILKSLNLEKNSEIILPSFCSPALINVILSLKLKPVLIDVDSKTFNIDVSKVKGKITRKTRVIIGVHLEGFPCEMKKTVEIAEAYNLKVIEDCAHALGAEYKNKKVGLFGDFSIFSFGMGKHLNTLGGGMIITKHRDFFEKLVELRNTLNKPTYFQLFKKLIKGEIASFFTKPILFYTLVYPSLRISRRDLVYRIFDENPKRAFTPEHLTAFSEFQAKLGLSQLKYIESKIRKRRKNAKIYDENLDNIKKQEKVLGSNPSYLNYSVIIKKREKVRRLLLAKGIDTQATWMKDCSSLFYNKPLPISKFLEESVLYLPIHENLNEDDIRRISQTLNEIVKI